MKDLHPAPRISAIDGLIERLSDKLGLMVTDVREEFGDPIVTITRDQIEAALRILRDDFEYQQLMDIAGVDYPSRPERFEVAYILLSITKNHRLLVKIKAGESTPVPTVTTLWPNAGWLEREVFDMFGVVFAGNSDLRRILTDYGFEGHPFRKDFPLTGYVEMRYSEEDKRVVYEPVKLQQDLREFDFMSPWEGADYVLPGDEKSARFPTEPPVAEVKTTESPAQTGSGKETDEKAADRVAPASTNATIAGQGHGDPAPYPVSNREPEAPDPTGARPDRGATGGANDREGAGPAPEGS